MDGGALSPLGLANFEVQKGRQRPTGHTRSVALSRRVRPKRLFTQSMYGSRAHRNRGTPMPNVPFLKAFADARNRHDIDTRMMHMAEGGVFISSSGERAEGSEAVREAFASVFEAFPDARWDDEWKDRSQGYLSEIGTGEAMRSLFLARRVTNLFTSSIARARTMDHDSVA